MNRDKTFVVLYFIMNLLVTYLLTDSTLNPNIVSFKTSFVSVVSSLLGNISILLMFYVVGTILFKKNKNLYKYLILITLLLNSVLVLLIYFTRSYKAMLSFFNLTLFRNPDAGFADQIIIDGILDIVTSWHVLCFLPFVVLSIYIFFIKRKQLNISCTKQTSLLLISLLAIFMVMSIYQKKIKEEWPFKSASPDFGVHYCGVYNYYFMELGLRVDYNENYYRNIDDSLDIADFNKGKIDDCFLEGMNIFVIQAESLQNFVIKDKSITPNLNKLILDENTFYFDNVHTVVGLGNTSDAEFTLNTGYYPVGDLTISWEAYDRLFDIQSLPKLFGDNYISYSYNPTIEGFYGHKYVHEKFYGFHKFKGLETYETLYPYSLNRELYLSRKWVSDQAILSLALGDAIDVLSQDKNFYIFLETISPHYPFSLESDKYPDNNYGYQDIRFNNYLNQINYIDEVLYKFIIKASSILSNTVFIIYGDHGNTLSKKSYEEFYKREIIDIDYRKMLLEIPVIIYDPSGKINNYIVNKPLDKSYILHRTLSQIDINATICHLFNLNPNHLLGVNMFSDLVSFAIDPKTMDFITDNYFYNYKNKKYKLYKDISFSLMMEEIEYMKQFKIANDNYLTKKIKG